MKKKKGFTLVELLVVIAILAVLATVSVVGYMGFTKKAHESNDASLTAQMNTALQANGVVKKNKTLTEAREDLLEAGIDLEKVTPTTDGYSYVWDSKQDLMFLLNENREVVAPTNATISANTVDSFVVVHNETEFNTWKSDYSLYFANGYESKQLILEKLVGIDAGTSGINNISVKDDSSTADVTMYTTSGTLTIDARQATVRHYGEAKTVSIKAIAGESYHEYGTVTGNIEVEDGHVSVENTANVSTIIAKPTESTKVKVTATNENNVGTIVTTDTSKTTFNVPESVKPTENITDDKLNEMNDFAGGLGTEKSPYLIENTEQFNIIFTKYHKQMKNGSYFYFSQVNDIILNMDHGDYYFNGCYDGNDYKIVAADNLDGIKSVFGVSRNNADIKNLNVYSTKKAGLFLLGYSFTSRYTDTYYNGSASFSNINTYVVDNEVLDLQGKNSANFSFFTCGAIYYMSAQKQIVVSFNNCNNYASIIANDRCAAFAGGYDGLDDGQHAKLIMKNCINYGNITAASDNAGAIVANSYATNGWSDMNETSAKEWVSLTNVKNYGIIKGKTAMAFAGTDSKHLLTTIYQDEIGGTYISTDGVLKDIEASLYYDNDKINVVSSSDKYSYVAYVVVDAINTIKGTYNSRSMDLDTIESQKNGTKIIGAHAYDRNIAIEKGIINESTHLEFKYSCTSFKVAIVEKDGILNLIFDNSEVSSVDCNVNLFVKAYNVSNEFVGAIEISK